MNDALIIQHVSENSPHVNLLKITAARNLEYCLKHKMDFEMAVNGEIPRTGHWDAIRMVRIAMEKPYQYIIYLDADTVIADLNADLRSGCPHEKIGATRHILKKEAYGIDLDHLNVGALYYYNCEATRAFVDKWLAGFPGTTEPSWFEQGVMNNINDGTVEEIDAKYNATGNVNPSPTPVVRGFHGQSGGNVRTLFDMMCAAIGK